MKVVLIVLSGMTKQKNLGQTQQRCIMPHVAA